MSGALDTLTRPVRGAWWWLTSVLGDHDYERYRAHALAHHPDEEPLSEREYWRRRWSEQEANPGARCC